MPVKLTLMASTSSNRKIDKIIAAAIGRRKTSVASVRLFSGTGEMTVNGKPISQYFPGPVAKTRYLLPFVTSAVSKYTASIKVHGGGLYGQLDAAVLGLSRALVAAGDKFKSPLRQAGLLTRDSRTRQRRMIGMGGKSRRKRQSPKR